MYKLIKTYPGSPLLNTIVKIYNGDYTDGKIIYNKNIIENNKEYWELVNDINVIYNILHDRILVLENELNYIKGNNVAETKKEYLTVKDVAKILNKSVYSIYQYTSNKQIPHYKNGNIVYFKLDEVNDWIKKGKIKQVEII